MNTSGSSVLTVLHDGQFWIALCERREESKYAARRFILGSQEPSDEQVFEFVLEQWASIDFVLREMDERTKVHKRINPKRQQRLVHKAVRGAEIGTRAQQAMKAQYEVEKTERAVLSKQSIEEEKQRRFSMKQQKKKQKHRGH